MEDTYFVINNQNGVDVDATTRCIYQPAVLCLSGSMSSDFPSVTAWSSKYDFPSIPMTQIKEKNFR